MCIRDSIYIDPGLCLSRCTVGGSGSIGLRITTLQCNGARTVISWRRIYKRWLHITLCACYGCLSTYCWWCVIGAPCCCLYKWQALISTRIYIDPGLCLSRCTVGGLSLIHISEPT